MASVPDLAMTLDRWSFGDSPALANALLALVLAGRKTATCWDARDGDKGTSVGYRSIVLDGGGNACAVLESVELQQCRFDDVDSDFAFDEGEGDRTLQAWRTAHRDYFVRNGHFAPNMLLFCERFRLVERL